MRANACDPMIQLGSKTTQGHLLPAFRSNGQVRDLIKLAMLTDWSDARRDFQGAAKLSVF